MNKDIKLFTDLDWAEQLKIYKSGDTGLNDDGLSMTLDWAQDDIGEYLGCLPSVSGYIGDRGEHISIKMCDAFRFFDEIEQLQRSMPLLCDRDEEILSGYIAEYNQLEREYEKMCLPWDFNRAEPNMADEIESKQQSLLDDIEDMLFYKLKGIYNAAFDSYNQLEALLDNDKFDGVYVLDGRVLSEEEADEILEQIEIENERDANAFKLDHLTGVSAIRNAINNYLDIIDSDMDAEGWEYSETITVKNLIYDMRNGNCRYSADGEIVYGC